MVGTESWLCRLRSSRRPIYMLLKESSYSKRKTKSSNTSFLLTGSGPNGSTGGSQFSSWITSLLPIAFAAAAYHSQHNFLSFSDNSTSIGSKERRDYVVKGSLKKLPQELLNELKLICQDNMSIDHEERIFHGTPQNSFHKAVNVPDVVVFPSCEEEVSEIIKACNRHRVPIVPYGGATSIEGHTLAPNGGVCINMTLMKATNALLSQGQDCVLLEPLTPLWRELLQANGRVKALHVDDMDVVVEPGIGWMDLNEYLEPYGLFFPLDPGPGATIGGMCATRCSGSLAVRYGTMRENVVSLKAVLPNGEIIKTGSRARKSAAGNKAACYPKSPYRLRREPCRRHRGMLMYDLTHLMIGSEGTLGVITEVTLRLQKIPPSSVVALCNFPTIKDAADVAMETMISGIQVSRVELLDEVQVRAINYVNGKNLPELPTLMFEFVGTEAYSREQTMIVQNIASEHNGSGFVFAEDPEAKKELWRIRKEALWAALAYAPNTEAMITDVCVPLSRLAELISLSKKELDASPLTCVIVAHAGDGNFHAIILFDPNDYDHRKEAERLDHYIVHTALSIEGTCTGEHGVGTGKMKYLEEEFGMEALRTMKKIKDALDPNGIMNPGKLIPPHVCF